VYPSYLWALLNVYRALLSVHRALCVVYRALQSVYRALLSVPGQPMGSLECIQGSFKCT